MEPLSSRPLRVLVAEDSEINQVVLQFVLRKLGHQPALVSNGREALDRLARETFDVVLMDVEMPELDGLQAATRIREGERGTSGHLPIIGLTAHETDGGRSLCLDAGMDGYLAKPAEAAALERELSRVLGTDS